MKHTIYIVLNRSGVDRLLKNPPERKAGEYPVAVTIDVPNSVFQQQPIPVVEIAITPKQINAAVISVDGEPADHPVDEATQKQILLQQQFAELFESARRSDDPAMRGLSDVILGKLLEGGVDVRIASQPAEEPTLNPYHD